MKASLYVNLKENGDIEVCLRNPPIHSFAATRYDTIHRMGLAEAAEFASDLNRAIATARIGNEKAIHPAPAPAANGNDLLSRLAEAQRYVNARGWYGLDVLLHEAETTIRNLEQAKGDDADADPAGSNPSTECEPAGASEIEELCKRLEIKSDMIQLGEPIAYGSDSKIMREAASLSRLTRENEGWAATCSRQVERIDRLEAENEELRGLVKDAHIALSAASRQLTNDHKHVLGGKTWGGALITRLTAAMRSANRAEIAPDQDVLIVSVRLASDHFETSLRLPVKEATKEKMDEFVTRWLDLMQAGLRTGFSYMSADLKGDNANG